MQNSKICSFCGDIFTPRRRNHKYCSPSCKTQASYKRNNYQYQPGRYIRNAEVLKLEQEEKALPSVIDEKFTELSDKIEKLSVENSKGSINVNSVTNAAIGTASANAITYGLQRIIAPQTLPATKQDVDVLQRELIELKTMINNLYFR